MKKLMIIIVLVFITGCSGYVELADIEVIENLAIDYSDSEYKIAVTSVLKNDEMEYLKKEATGKTLSEAIFNLKTKENKKIYIACLKMLLLTEDVVENNLEDVIDFFIDNSESRNDFDVGIISDLSALDNASDIKSKVDIIYEDLAMTKSILFEEFFSDILEDKVTYLPVLSSNLTVDGIKLIRNRKIITHLDKDECILYNFMTSSVSKTVFNDVNILSSNTVKNFDNGKLNIQLSLVTSSKDNEIKDSLKNKIIEMFNKYRDKNIDVFNIEEDICSKNQKFCKNNKSDLLNKVKLSIEIIIKNKNDYVGGDSK